MVTLRHAFGKRKQTTQLEFGLAPFVCLTHYCMHACMYRTLPVYDSEAILPYCSKPPGMIINLIIKHLLPTAPALSLPLPPLDPPGPHHRESERERRGRDTGGARGRGWSEESSKSEGVIITLLDSFTPARGACFVWWQTACEVM